MKEWYFYIEIPIVVYALVGVILHYYFRKDVRFGILFLFFNEMAIRDSFNTKFVCVIGNRQLPLDYLFIICFFSTFLINRKKNAEYFSTMLFKGYFKYFFGAIAFCLILGMIFYRFDALSDSIPVVLPFCLVLYVASFRYTDIGFNKLKSSLFKLSIALIIIAVAKYIFLLNSPYLALASYYDYRVIDRSAVMFLVLIIFYLTFYFIANLAKINMYRNQLLYSFVLMLLVITSTLRLAWVFIALFYALLMFSHRKVLQKYFLKIIPLMALIIIAMFIFAGDYVQYFIDSIVASFSAQTDVSSSTLSFREEITSLYIEAMSFFDYLWGSFFGRRPTITLIAGQEYVGLHNQYVFFLFFMGVSSVVVFILFNIVLLKKIFHNTKSELNSTKKNILLASFYSLLIYLIGNYFNTFDYVYPLVVGYSLSVLNATMESNLKA